MRSLDLTICSVCYKSVDYLKLNWELTTQLTYPLHWMVVKNCKEDEIPSCFQVIPGVEYPAISNDLSDAVGNVSYHHAAALNKMLPLLQSRFVLFLDPDFYIVPNLERIIEWMKSYDWTFFGAPYALRVLGERIQDFPVAFCLLVDTSRVAIHSWDFTPDHTRSDIFADTGYKIYNKYKDSSHRYDIALPTYYDDKSIGYRHTSESIKYLYNIDYDTPMDEYFFWSQLFGLHARMKTHLIYRKKGALVGKRRQLKVAKLKEIERVVNKVRQHDSTM